MPRKHKEETFKYGEKTVENFFEKLPHEIFLMVLPICLHCRLVSKLFKEMFDEKFKKLENYEPIDKLKLLINIRIDIYLARYDGFFLKILYKINRIKEFRYLEIINLKTNRIKKIKVLDQHEFNDLNIGDSVTVISNSAKLFNNYSINITNSNEIISNKIFYLTHYDQIGNEITLFKNDNIINKFQINYDFVFEKLFIVSEIKFYLFKTKNKTLYVDLIKNGNSKEIIKYKFNFIIDKIFPYLSYKGKILNILLTDQHKNIYYTLFSCK